MIDLTQINRRTLETEPYTWAAVDNLFSPKEAEALATSYPRDNFKTLSGYGGEKNYEYEARQLIAMGSNAASHPEGLSKSWLELASDLVSPAYRTAMSLLTKRDLTTAPMEVNVFHYGPGASLGAHTDLPEKLVTHVLYFNQSWKRENGGCLSILNSKDELDMAAQILPIVGNSVVLVRSDKSWHAVSRVVNESLESRRSMTVTFYSAGSTSSMWPPDDKTPLHRYDVH
jgi:SM-20-related protein